MNSKQRRQQRQAQEAAHAEAAAAPVPLQIGDHRFPVFNALSAAFGANAADYPDRDKIPEEFSGFSGKFQRIASAFFSSGGKLEDHGIRFKAGINQTQAMTALRSLLCSWAPKHEVKISTVAWALSEWTEPVSSAR